MTTDPPENIFRTDPQNGLTADQVRQRQAAGLSNAAAPKKTKTIRQILAGNLLTYFNLINILIFAMILTTGQIANTLFMGVVLLNTLIGIVQEIRAKRVLDRLAILTEVQATVIRDKVRQRVPVEEIVLDDLLLLAPGDQVSVDGTVLEHQALEIDESLLTGEAEPVLKQPGAGVLSGSFVVAGSAAVQVRRVGPENYARKITAEIRSYKRAKSEILVALNRLVRVMSVAIVPAGLLLFINHYLRGGQSWQDAIIGSAAAMIGMIPEGLILLTSATLAVGVIRLARRRAVVQELAGIEVLARADVLCLDKTGTLTQGRLKVSRMIPLAAAAGQPPADEARLREIAAAVLAACGDKNSTALALSAYAGDPPAWPAIRQVPFSSARKWSGASFADQGTWLLGAPEILLCDRCAEIREQAFWLAEAGNRVILLVRAAALPEGGQLIADVAPQALFLLSDTIRPEARAALDFFAENDVTVKIFSGDHPAAVVSVARELGIKNAERWIDATKLPDDPQALSQAVRDFSVFGRVTPQQKKKLVAALKESGHTVAMTGDGVNDTLALREADCGIAMASGADAAKQTAHMVLLDSDFTALPGVVREGRQVINNIERVASLFLVKTTYAAVLTLVFTVIGATYPFDPIHQTLLGSFSIGIPAFFLALERNWQRVRPAFLRRVVLTAVPGGLSIAVMIILLEVLRGAFRIMPDQVSLIAFFVTGMNGLMVLLRVSSPLNWRRMFLLLAMAALFLSEAIVFAGMLSFTWPEPQSLLLAGLLSLASYPLILGLSWLLRRQKISSIKTRG